MFTSKERDAELLSSAISNGLDYFGECHFSSGAVMNTVRSAGGAFLGLIFLVLTVANGWAVVSYLRSRRHTSAVPMIGGLCGVFALIIFQ
jgi:hypothetical protein